MSARATPRETAASNDNVMKMPLIVAANTTSGNSIPINQSINKFNG